MSTTAAVDRNAIPLPEIWNEIEREVAVLKRNAEKPIHGDMLWEPAQKIARRHDRSVIDTLFNSWSDCDKSVSKENIRLVRRLAAYVAVEIADPEMLRGLKVLFKRSELSGSNYYGVLVAAVDCYRDDASREWLHNVVLDRTDKYWACVLPLLRGYESTPKLTKRLEQALQAEQFHRSSISNPALTDALRALLSSFRYAANLVDTKERRKYHNFESRFWRARMIGPRGFIGQHMEHREAASLFNQQWQAGDEKFLLRIFEDPASAPEELEMAVNLAYRLKDTYALKLKAIAEDSSRQAPYASRALPGLEHKYQGGPYPFGGPTTDKKVE